VQCLVEQEVLGAEFRHVHEPFNVEIVEHDEDTERHDRTDSAAVDLADTLPHVVALQPGLDVP